MTAPLELDRVWQPIQIGPMTLKNRIIVPAREARWSRLDWVDPAHAKRILVVGGGPSGLKLASVAARRGHEVTLVEEQDELGGHLNLLAALPRQGGWTTAADDLIQAARNAGVSLRTGTRASADFVRAFDAHRVYLATGAYYDDRGVSVWRPEVEEVPGIHASNVLTVDEAVRRVLADGGAALGGHVVIADESGTYLPLALAELLAASGTRTQIVTGQMFVGREAVRHLQLPWIMPQLIEAGVEFIAQRRLDAVTGSSVVMSDRWLDNSYVIDDVSTVVLSLYRRSRTALFDELPDLGDRVARIGDALAPRKLAELIYEGELIGRGV